MPTQDLIQVSIYLDGSRATEYAEPVQGDGDKSCVRYIETKPGQKFTVRFSFLQGFQMFEADRLILRVDQNGTSATCNIVPRAALHCFQEKVQQTYSKVMSLTAFKDETGNYLAYHWAFEGVEASKPSCYPLTCVDLAHYHLANDASTLTADEKAKIGSVCVTVSRVKTRKKTAYERERELASEDSNRPAPIKDLAEKDCKGAEIKQAVL
jgi:hypothetical protein